MLRLLWWPFQDAQQVGRCAWLRARRDRAKELKSSVGRAVLGLCHTVLPVSLVALHGCCTSGEKKALGVQRAMKREESLRRSRYTSFHRCVVQGCDNGVSV